MKSFFALFLIAALMAGSFAQDSATVVVVPSMSVPASMPASASASMSASASASMSASASATVAPSPSSSAGAGSQCKQGDFCLFIFKDPNAANNEGTNATCSDKTYVSETRILLNTPCFPINTESDNTTRVWAVVNTTNTTIDGNNVTQYDGALYTDATCSGNAMPFGCSERCTDKTCLNNCMTDTCVPLPVNGWAYYLASDFSSIPAGTVPSSIIPSGGASSMPAGSSATMTVMVTSSSPMPTGGTTIVSTTA